MSISNLFQPNELTLFTGYLSIDQDFDSNNGAYYQFHGTVVTTNTTLTTISKIDDVLPNGKYILNLYVNANTTAGPQINGGVSYILNCWINVVGGLLSITTFSSQQNPYIYAMNALTVTVVPNLIVQNALNIQVQNTIAGNTTTWTAVGQLFGPSLHS
jgi:hypothetical protein